MKYYAKKPLISFSSRKRKISWDIERRWILWGK